MANLDKPINSRARLCGILGEARDMLLREVKELRAERRHLSEKVRTTSARLERLRQQVAFQRARRDRIKKGNSP